MTVPGRELFQRRAPRCAAVWRPCQRQQQTAGQLAQAAAAQLLRMRLSSPDALSGAEERVLRWASTEGLLLLVHLLLAIESNTALHQQSRQRNILKTLAHAGSLYVRLDQRSTFVCSRTDHCSTEWQAMVKR